VAAILKDVFLLVALLKGLLYLHSVRSSPTVLYYSFPRARISGYEEWMSDLLAVIVYCYSY
jgi:hypothetical protein